MEQTTAAPATRAWPDAPDVDIEPGYMQPASTPRQQILPPEQQKQPQVEHLSILRCSQEHLGDVFEALAAAQGQFGEVERTLKAKIQSAKANYEYEYAPLDEVLQAIRPAMSQNGLSVMQFPFPATQQNGLTVVTVRTLIGHKSGGWFSNDIRMTSEGSAPREVGSAITYARRYSLMSIVGVAPAVDDDGGAAGQKKADPPRPAQRRSAAPEAAGGPAAPDSPQAAPPAPPAAPPSKASSSKLAKAPRTGQGSPAAPETGKTPAEPVAPPAASQDVPAQPAHVGRIADLQEKPNGAIVTLDTGFKAASKDAAFTTALRVHRQVNATINLATRPSSDPSRFAPVITGIDIVKAVRSREPGEEG